MACSTECPLNKATTVSRKDNLLRDLITAALWEVIQIASVASESIPTAAETKGSSFKPGWEGL